MKNTFFVFTFLLCSFCINAQKKYHKSYYKNGQLKEEGWIVDSKKNGYWKFYFSNGVIQKEGHFLNNLKTKYWYFYRKNSTKEKEGHFKNDKKNSWWLFYTKNGEVNHKCQLKNNHKNGFCFRYHLKELISAEKYKKGKKIKEWTDLKTFKEENNLFDLH